MCRGLCKTNAFYAIRPGNETTRTRSITAMARTGRGCRATATRHLGLYVYTNLPDTLIGLHCFND